MQSKFARHRRARQRQRLMRLTLVSKPESKPGRVRQLAAYHSMAVTDMRSAGTVLCIGDYVVGDEHCPWLYGPTNVRY